MLGECDARGLNEDELEEEADAVEVRETVAETVPFLEFVDATLNVEDKVNVADPPVAVEEIRDDTEGRILVVNVT